MSHGIWSKSKPVTSNKSETSVVAIKQSFLPSSRNIHDQCQSQSKVQESEHAKSEKRAKDETKVDLKVAILDKRYPRVILTRDQVRLLEDKLVEALETGPASSVNLRFDGTDFNDGIMWLSCANEATKNWLKDRVTLFGSLWEDSQLSAVDSKNIPKRYKIRIILKDNDDESDIRNRLLRQNSGLNISDWFLLDRCNQGDELIINYSVDEGALRSLEKLEFKVYYKLGRVTIKVLENDKGY